MKTPSLNGFYEGISSQIICGVPRSPHWSKLRSEWLKSNNCCVACGSTNLKMLNVHHKKPYHLFPKLELTETNLITLCETPTHNCHFIVGHCLDWTKYNNCVVSLSKLMFKCILKRKGK